MDVRKTAYYLTYIIGHTCETFFSRNKMSPEIKSRNFRRKLKQNFRNRTSKIKIESKFFVEDNFKLKFLVKNVFF